ncbi:alkaline phosphatase family protein [Arthrobacter crusticola]|uniref:Alkaline phosphatase family protein n=1 Tax=Arthrobacter crusticola TaxID=2547960 RepID=A0A4R5TN72_9MICC|nr:nucleotide pyrophosphatase/phosphodiesterase family protein [Arthrobacter crusticola]TDK24135.1 alkaline phosphatase family protein [Arthrobacter crusticola]
MTSLSTHLEPLPAPPAYGAGTVGEVLTSAAACLGLGGFGNALGLPPSRRVCVVMVDGLGLSQLKKRGGHAPFLRSHLEGARTLGSAFPSTTAASLASLGTGLPPGLHGMVGYDVLDPAQDKVVNMLGNWDDGVDPVTWQPHPTVFERAARDVPVVTVSQPRFADSAMTRAALRGGSFLGAGTLQARVRGAAEQLAGADTMLMYFYLNDLDKAGHRHGCASTDWTDRLEDLDSAMKSLARQMPADTLLLLTADHGMVDVAEGQRFDYSARPALVDGIAHTAGEPRMVHLYFEPGLDAAGPERLRAAWQEAFGRQAWILTRGEAVAAGLFGPTVDASVLPRIGDLLVAAREPIALFDTRRTSASALEVIGQHGSMTRAEREVPLLTLRRPEPVRKAPARRGAKPTPERPNHG